mmetsp:Transcript_22979/g.25991  ORF Transcript_22979/g.25991 Transcript_22979/m.25991 type:complete len:594 (-) Transcript_22979:633-2414(-)
MSSSEKENDELSDSTRVSTDMTTQETIPNHKASSSDSLVTESSCDSDESNKSENNSSTTKTLAELVENLDGGSPLHHSMERPRSKCVQIIPLNAAATGAEEKAAKSPEKVGEPKRYSRASIRMNKERMRNKIKLSLDTNQIRKNDFNSKMRRSESFFEYQKEEGNVEDFYEFQEGVLGAGTHGCVKRARCLKDNHEVAIKIIRSNDPEIVNVAKSSYKLLKKLAHPNIITVDELFVDEVKSRIHLIMGLVKGAELFKILFEEGAYTEKQASSMFRQLMNGISYLHSHGICHRDIKPSNLLVSDEGCLKITDFDVSKYSSTGKIQMLTPTGTMAFSAPELLQDCVYDEKVDIWSCGCVLYTMLSGEQPFNSENTRTLIHQIVNCDYTLTGGIWDNISEEGKDVIRKCFTADPEQRSTADEILNLPWVQGVNNNTDTISYQSGSRSRGVSFKINQFDFQEPEKRKDCILKRAESFKYNHVPTRDRYLTIGNIDDVVRVFRRRSIDEADELEVPAMDLTRTHSDRCDSNFECIDEEDEEEGKAKTPGRKKKRDKVKNFFAKNIKGLFGKEKKSKKDPMASSKRAESEPVIDLGVKI